MSTDRGELVSAGCALALLACMFAFAWFGGVGVPGTAPRARLVWTESAWQALAVVRWAMLVTIIVAVGSVLLHISQRTHGARTSTGPAVAALGSLTSILLIYRVLIDMPKSTAIVDAKLGAVLGTLMALGIAAGGLRSLRTDRHPAPRRARRPLVSRRREG